MSIDIEPVLIEEHTQLSTRFRIHRSLITFTGETAQAYLRELEEIAKLRNKQLDSRSAYNLTTEALNYLDELVNPIGFKSSLPDLPLGRDRSLTSVLGWSTYKVEGYPGMTRYQELTTEKGELIHKDYCRILEIPQNGRGYPLSRLVVENKPLEAVGGINQTGGG